MSLQDAAQAAGVNPHNGSSIDAVQAKTFQGLWDNGAFAQTGPAGEELQREPQRQEPRQPRQQAPQAAPQQQAVEQPEVEAEPEVTAEAEQELEYADLDDYLTKAQIERESFLAMPVNVKVDGKTSRVPLADVLKAYQLEQHVQAKSIQVSEAQKVWEAQRAEQQNAIKAQLDQAGELGKLAHAQLLAEFQGIDWNKLRMEDPARWSVLNQDFRNRADQIQLHMNQVEQARQSQAQAAQAERQKALPQQYERMLEARPDWRDSTKFQAARSEMLDYARKQGFSQAELDGIYDYRSMLVLHDAARFAALQAQSPQALKRVRAAPQMANPGARVTRDPQAVARGQAKERFMKNRKDPEAQAAYFETLAT